MTTKIEWAEESWNPVTGCTPCSPGCDHCYAKRMAHRLKGRYGYPKDDPFRVTLHWNRLDMPLRWNKSRRVFVCSMSDLFHDDVSFDFINRVLFFAYQSYKRKHIFIFLTKRPEKMSAALDNWRRCNALELLPKNWHIGVTVCNQKEADAKIPILLQIPAAVRFVSVEPMLDLIDLSPYLKQYYCLECKKILPDKYTACICRDARGLRKQIQWVICGGETGPEARPMHPDWARSLKDQCVSADVPFFFKQWGEWTAEPGWYLPDKFGSSYKSIIVDKDKLYKTGISMGRVGKKKAGRLLDGKEWNQYPERGDG